MKRFLVLIISAVLLLSMSVTAFAQGGQVIYDGNAKQFIFSPGNNYSPTDLFPDFKDIVPGDSITQKLTLKNDVSNNVKVNIYMRSLGAQEDSIDFLSKMNLSVKLSDDNDMAYMFNASADQTTGLDDWVFLGLLYSGGEVNLDVTLDVPVELDNSYQERVGYIDWEFKIEEFPVEATDPVAPKTGDNINMFLWITLGVATVSVIIVFIFLKRKENNEQQAQVN